jgi:hypothetical protein
VQEGRAGALQLVVGAHGKLVNAWQGVEGILGAEEAEGDIRKAGWAGSSCACHRGQARVRSAKRNPVWPSALGSSEQRGRAQHRAPPTYALSAQTPGAHEGGRRHASHRRQAVPPCPCGEA